MVLPHPNGGRHPASSDSSSRNVRPWAGPEAPCSSWPAGPVKRRHVFFNLRSTLWQRLFPGYTVAAYDNRGTGELRPTRIASGFLQVRNHRIFGLLGGRHVSARF